MTVVTCTVEVTFVWAASAPAGRWGCKGLLHVASGRKIERVLSPQVVNPVLIMGDGVPALVLPGARLA